MISIIIPTLNEEKVIEKTLRSLRRLNSVDYEIIVSDGKSTDRTVEIAKKYADKVVEYKGEKRQTIAGGRNAGAAAAKGDYFVFIDADVEIGNINQFFQRALGYFEREIRLVALTVFIKVFPENATLADDFFFGALNIWFYICNNFFHIGNSGGEFQMVKDNAFRKINGYNEKLIISEDDDLFRRLSKIGITRSEAGLEIYHTSRRAHQVGWPRLLFLWTTNSLWNIFFKRSFISEWEEIR